MVSVKAEQAQANEGVTDRLAGSQVPHAYGSVAASCDGDGCAVEHSARHGFHRVEVANEGLTDRPTGTYGVVYDSGFGWSGT